MFDGASYDQVARSGIIHADDLAEDLAASSAVQREFREELTNLARAMAKTKTGRETRTNKPLLAELIAAFRGVDCAVLVTKDQISSRGKREKTLVFLLHHPGRPFPVTPAVAKPHKGKLVLFCDEDDKLYIPVPLSPCAADAALIPFPLTAENVQSIGGSIGKNLSDAFRLGVKDAAGHKTARPRIRREHDRALLDREEMAEYRRSNNDLRRCER